MRKQRRNAMDGQMSEQYKCNKVGCRMNTGKVNDNYCPNCSYLIELKKKHSELEEKVYSSLVDIHTIWSHGKDGYKELSKEKYDYVMDLLIKAIPFDEVEERVCRSEDDDEQEQND
jgi:hypothetical protein